MGIETTIYTPRTLGKLVRRMPPVHTFFRDTFFKNRRTFNTKSVDVDFKKGSRALAPFVHPKVGGKTILNTGYQTKSYTPVLLAPNKITTVDDLLERAAGEDPYSGRKPAERAVEKLAEDLRELNEMIVRREEWMAATAIFTGQIPIVGEGVNEVIDFDFTNKETIVSAEKKWDNAQSDPLADIERWHEIVQREGFVNCNVCVMAKDVATAFINHAKVKEVLDVKAYDLAVIKPRQLPNGATYIGTYHKLGLDFYQYNEWYLDDWTEPGEPENKPIVPDKHIALLYTEADYSIYYGAITMIPEEGKGFVTVEGDKVPQTWIERRPDRRFLQINSKPLTVPHEVNSWYVAPGTLTMNFKDQVERDLTAVFHNSREHADVVEFRIDGTATKARSSSTTAGRRTGRSRHGPRGRFDSCRSCHVCSAVPVENHPAKGPERGNRGLPVPNHKGSPGSRGNRALHGGVDRMIQITADQIERVNPDSFRRSKRRGKGNGKRHPPGQQHREIRGPKGHHERLRNHPAECPGRHHNQSADAESGRRGCGNGIVCRVQNPPLPLQCLPDPPRPARDRFGGGAGGERANPVCTRIYRKNEKRSYGHVRAGRNGQTSDHRVHGTIRRTDGGEQRGCGAGGGKGAGSHK